MLSAEKDIFKELTVEKKIIRLRIESGGGLLRIIHKPSFYIYETFWLSELPSGSQ